MTRVATVLAVLLLASGCSGTPEGGAEHSSSPSPSPSVPRPPSTTAAPPTPSEPEAPAARTARRLDEVVRTVRDPDAPARDVRAAGELQQLAVRALAQKPRARRAVLRRVAPRTARMLRNDLEAAGQLTSLTAAQQRLPDWRIVQPPPPARLMRYYRAAERRTGTPWRYLAAIHLVETRMGRIRGTSSAGAQGPMQFIPPTWERYGAGGDVRDYRDAIIAAGRLLRDHGAPRDMANALYHYNPSERYVRAVSAYARNLAREPMLYRAYWHWRVLYKHRRGTYVLPEGYPRTRPELLPGR